MSAVEEIAAERSSAETENHDSDITHPYITEEGHLVVPVLSEDGEITSMAYVPKVVVDVEAEELRRKLALAERKIELLKEELRNNPHKPNFSIPCAICGELVTEDEARSQNSCCQRVTHTHCILGTNFRSKERFPSSFCSHCIVEKSREKIAKMRAGLISEYNSNPGADDLPSNNAMLSLCQACGFLADKKIWSDRLWNWTDKQAEEVYRVYKSLRKTDFFEKSLTLAKLNAMGITIHHLVRDFDVRKEDLFPSSRNVNQNLNMTHTDISVNQKYAVAFLLAGVDAQSMHYRGITLSTIQSMHLEAEALCIFGFTAAMFIMMGFQKDQFKNFSWITLPQWIELLGLDDKCIYQLHLRENDFSRGGDLQSWDMVTLAQNLKLNRGQMMGLIERSKKKNVDLAQGEKYGFKVKPVVGGSKKIGN